MITMEDIADTRAWMARCADETEREAAKAVGEVQAGTSVREVAARFGVTVETVRLWLEARS